MLQAERRLFFVLFLWMFGHCVSTIKLVPRNVLFLRFSIILHYGNDYNVINLCALNAYMCCVVCMCVYIYNALEIAVNPNMLYLFYSIHGC